MTVVQLTWMMRDLIHISCRFATPVMHVYGVAVSLSRCKMNVHVCACVSLYVTCSSSPTDACYWSVVITQASLTATERDQERYDIYSSAVYSCCLFVSG